MSSAEINSDTIYSTIPAVAALQRRMDARAGEDAADVIAGRTREAVAHREMAAAQLAIHVTTHEQVEHVQPQVGGIAVSRTVENGIII